MIDTDKYGMTNEELLKRYSNLSVDDYKELLAEVERLRGGIERALAVIIGMKVNRPVQNILEEAIG
jgi:hypothetical protein